MTGQPAASERNDGERPWSSSDEIRIGISSCLLGEEVRWDGGHKRQPFLLHTVAQFVSFAPVCPEVEVGMGVPRETVRLVQLGDTARMVAKKSGTDWTTKMRSYAKRRARELKELDLCGFILKKDSPSCGMERVKIYAEGGGMPKKDGVGLFAEALMAELPFLPVEEEGRLNDPPLRENFYVRVFAYRRLRSLFQRRFTVGELVAFHSREKLLLLAHDRPAYQALGKLVAAAKGTPRAELKKEYQETFMAGLKKLATRRKHTNVLQHIAGYFKKQLTDDQRVELHDLIDDFRRGLVPLIVPLTLARHHVRSHGVDYLAGQTYLEPHPKELMLRNQV